MAGSRAVGTDRRSAAYSGHTAGAGKPSCPSFRLSAASAARGIYPGLANRARLDIHTGTGQPPLGHRPSSCRPARQLRTRPIETEPTAKTPRTRKQASAAGPEDSPTPRVRAPRKRKAVDPSRLDQLQGIITTSLDDDKAEDIVVLDLVGRAAFADRMIIATGLADRQITAMATHLSDKLAEVGVRQIRIEGANGSDWVLIDAGDMIVHLFKPEARMVYGLERMWAPDLDAADADAATA